VEAVLEGTVRRSGERVRITAQLIEAATDRSLWAHTYARDIRDILELQSEVAQAVAREIQITVTADEESRLAQSRPVDPRAYEAFLRARHHLSFWRLEEALVHIRAAIDRDPTYAPTHALLARYYVLLAYRINLAPKEVFPKARAAVTTALKLDPSLAFAHAVSAYIRSAFDWDWEVAEREYRLALELNPGIDAVHSSYSLFLSAVCRHEEAIAEAMKARELNPLDPQSNMNLGKAFHFARRYEEAIEQLQETIEMYPDFYEVYAQLGFVYGRKGLAEEAVASLQKAITLSGGSNLRTKAWLAQAYALWGKRKEVLKILDELLEQQERRYVPPAHIGSIYMGLGQKERALQWFEKAYEARDADMAWIQNEPLLTFSDDIRSDPRFKDLLRRLNFPE
jgi:tetratricopeptide (TPR) repeat protein